MVVSYNDPVGSHKYVTPVTLSAPDEDLLPYSEDKNFGVGVEIVTADTSATGANTTDIILRTYRYHLGRGQPVRGIHQHHRHRSQ